MRAAAATPVETLAAARGPQASREQQLLQVVLQFPAAVALEEVDALPAEAFVFPVHRAVYEAVAARNGQRGDLSVQGWVQAVTDSCGEALAPAVRQLAVAEIPAPFDRETGLPAERYVTALFDGLHEGLLQRGVAEIMSRLQRTDPADSAAVHAVQTELWHRQRELAELKGKAQ